MKCLHREIEWVSYTCTVRCLKCGATKPCAVSQNEDRIYIVTPCKKTRWSK